MTSTVRILFNLMVLISFVAILCNCSTPAALPSAEDYKMISAGKRSVVLLRVTCEIEGEPFEVFQHMLNDENIGLALGSFETGGEPQQIIPTFLSNQTRKYGWLYLMLEPGLYYLAVQPPRQEHVMTYANSFKNAPLWKLDIPPQNKIIYVGTLHIPSIKQSIWFGGITIKSSISDGIVVRDDADLARKIAADYFPEFDTFNTMLMQRHEGPIILKRLKIIK